MKHCPRCNYARFWHLSTGQWRCKHCGRTRKFRQTFWNKNRISPYLKGKLLEMFCLGVPVYRLRFRITLDPKTVQRWLKTLREVIYNQTMRELQNLSGTIEMDETMFGGKVPGKRVWGASGKQVVFGIYKRNGKVLTLPISSRAGDNNSLNHPPH